MANYKYTANVHSFGNDVNGNPISHFELWDHTAGDIVARTHKRRTQCGYSSERAEHVVHALYQITGLWYEPVVLRGSRSADRMRIGLRKPGKVHYSARKAA